MKPIRYYIFFKWIVIGLLFLTQACRDSKRLIIKEIRHNDLTVTWYRESYITDTKAFVSMETNRDEGILLKCNDNHITDVALYKDTIKIKYFGSKLGIESSLPKFKNYYVKVDTTVTFDDWNRYYNHQLFNKKGEYKKRSEL